MEGNIIICGAPRAGSTALYRYLAAHSSVISSKVKEMNYFIGSRTAYEDAFCKDGQDKACYQKLFDKTSEGQLTLEASPAYMHHWCSKKVASRISSTLPGAKVIFILREPVLRLHSQYLADITRGEYINHTTTFDKYIEGCLYQNKNGVFNLVPESQRKLYLEGLSIGEYAKIVEQYVKFCGAENVFIMFAENLKENTAQEMQSLAAYLGIDSTFYSGMEFERENKTISPRNKFVYQVSLKVNRLFEPFLNKFPQVRSFLRRIHDRFNKGKGKPELELSELNRGELRRYYAESHLRLLGVINQTNSSGSFPEWLKVLKGKLI